MTVSGTQFPILCLFPFHFDSVIAFSFGDASKTRYSSKVAAAVWSSTRHCFVYVHSHSPTSRGQEPPGLWSRGHGVTLAVEVSGVISAQELGICSREGFWVLTCLPAHRGYSSSLTCLLKTRKELGCGSVADKVLV